MGHDQIWSLSYSRSKLSVRPTSIALVRPSLARSHKIKSMVSIKDSTITPNEADEAAHIDQHLWIVGYETEREGCAVSRLKKILRGMKNLSMVGDDAWNKYIQDASAIMHAAISEDVLDTVPSWRATTQKTMPSLKWRRHGWLWARKRATRRCRSGAGKKSRSRTTAPWRP